MEGPAPDVSIRTVLQLIATAHQDRSVLVVIDQFEDLLPQLNTQSSKGLLEALTDAHNAPTPNLHMIVCYRGDAEPKVGSFWQQISGSPSGLPRYYLGPLSETGAASVLGTVLNSLFPSAPEAGFQVLIERIVSDVAAESLSSLDVTFYPHFLQMVVEGILKARDRTNDTPSIDLYLKLGSSKHLIGRYLSDQLLRLGPRANDCRLVLIHLSSNQRRQRKSTLEISAQTGIELPVLDSCLLDLQNLRLIHAVADQWEVVHDFLSQKIGEELVAPDEREGRLLRDVLAAKANAYESTGEVLTFKEHLGIYFHRRRIHCSSVELEALFISHLNGNGPIEYFLQGIDPEIPAAWAQTMIGDSDTSVVRMACRYLIRSGRKIPLTTLAKAFSKYRFQAEMADYIRSFAGEEDVPLLLRLRSHKAPMISAAAGDLLEEFLNPECKETAQKLLRRGDLVVLCKLFVNSANASLLSDYRKELKARALLTRVHGACGLAVCGKRLDLVDLATKLQSPDTGANEKYACAFALAFRFANTRQNRTIAKLQEMGPDVLAGILDAFHQRHVLFLVRHLLRLYERSPHAIASAVLDSAGPRDAAHLRRFLKSRELGPEARDVVLGLVKVGKATDIRLILDWIGAADYKVRFWNVPVLTSMMAGRADTSLKVWLIQLTESREFWEYLMERPSNPLPVLNRENLYLFKRTVGVILAALCDKSDWPLLKRLVFHPYWSIQIAASEKISGFVTSAELDEVVAEGRSKAKGSPDEGVIYALNILDQKLHRRRTAVSAVAAVL